MPPRGGLLDVYTAHLDRRWAEGCRNAAQLWRELVATGFPGRSAIVRAWATRRRKAEPDADAGEAGVRAAAKQPPPASQVARLLMADTEALAEEERAFVARLLAQAPALADAVAVAKRLNLLLRRKGGENLGKLIEDATGTQLAEFAAGLRRGLHRGGVFAQLGDEGGEQRGVGGREHVAGRFGASAGRGRAAWRR